MTKASHATILMAFERDPSPVLQRRAREHVDLLLAVQLAGEQRWRRLDWLICALQAWMLVTLAAQWLTSGR